MYLQSINSTHHSEVPARASFWQHFTRVYCGEFLRLPTGWKCTKVQTVLFILELDGSIMLLFGGGRRNTIWKKVHIYNKPKGAT